MTVLAGPRGALVATALAVALATVRPGEATTVRAVDDEQLCCAAREIFHGVCVEARSERLAGGRIVTRYRFSVLEGLKGVQGGATELLQPGGDLGHEALLVPGAARFAPGEEVVAFVGHPHPETGCAFTVGLAQGKFTVTREGGRALAVRDLEGLRVVGAAARGDRRQLDELLETVRGHVRRPEGR